MTPSYDNTHNHKHEDGDDDRNNSNTDRYADRYAEAGCRCCIKIKYVSIDVVCII